jgi:RNA-directed DNA polymerase
MGLMLNESKTRHIDARAESFNFSWIYNTLRQRYKRQELPLLEYRAKQEVGAKNPDKVKDYLKTHGHYKAHVIASGLNSINQRMD